MASLRTVGRPVRRALPRAVAALRPFSTTPGFRARVSNAPPVDPATQGEMGVGELEGAEFKIEPMRRVGEDERTMRARLVYQSRKRGTLESDLLLSTFADRFLPSMSQEQMAQYDLFLDENDWDIYYWATQEVPSPVKEALASSSSSSSSAVDSASSSKASTHPTKNWTPTSPFADSSSNTTAGKDAAAAAAAASEEPYRKPGEGEWAQTIGTFKPAYRPVPARWRDSEVLRLLREHVKSRSKGGEVGGGMGFMPSLKEQK
ncbi:TPR repeat protein [Xylariales sp. AK1849]|nr:TPR repeat protein [Xylariales sp. AK1849]